MQPRFCCANARNYIRQPKPLYMEHRSFIKAGLLTLGVAGLVYSLGDVLLPNEADFLAARERPQAFAALVTSQPFWIWSLRGMFGEALQAFGALGLLLLLRQTGQYRLGMWSTVLFILAAQLGMTFFTICHHVFPEAGRLMLAGQSGAEVMKLAIMPDFLLASMVLKYVGLILSAVALARSNCVPKWCGWVVLLGFLLIMVPLYAVQIGANMLWGIAYLWMAFTLQEPYQAPRATQQAR